MVISQDRQDEPNLSDEGRTNYYDKLSPSAKAALRFLRELEEGGEVELFQSDPDIERLQQVVDSYRGSIYSVLTKRLQYVCDLGGVSVVTQRDLMSLISSLWKDNISRFNSNELQILRGSLENPGLNPGALSKHVKLSYPQTRRALARLNAAGVLKTIGLLDIRCLGLERVLIRLENPNLVLSGPFIQNIVFVDGDVPIVYQTLTVPVSFIGELKGIIRNLRSDAKSATAWHLSKGRPRFNKSYYNTKSGEWRIDLLHFRLLLRSGGEEIVVGNLPVRSSVPEKSFTESDLKIIDYLLENYEATAPEIAKVTSLSQSTTFRQRSKILGKGIILPRANVTIPRLSDRVIAILSPEVSGNITPAWNALPLTYTSLLQNIENTQEKKICLLSALPSGQGTEIIRVLNQEKSRVDDLVVQPVVAGSRHRISISSMFDRETGKWRWQPDVWDLRSYSVVRRESLENRDIPLDLA